MAEPQTKDIKVAYGIDVALMLDSRVLGDQEFNQGMKQRFASLSDVVYKLEEPQVKWELLL